MLWVKSFHLIFMVTWFAGLFYLPRLFVYHAMSEDAISLNRFKIMEQKLFFGIMTPGGILTIGFGLWMLIGYGWDKYEAMHWMQVKLILVALLVAYHIYLAKLLFDFSNDRNRHGHIYYRWLNEVPAVILMAIVILVVVRPF